MWEWRRGRQGPDYGWNPTPGKRKGLLALIQRMSEETQLGKMEILLEGPPAV